MSFSDRLDEAMGLDDYEDKFIGSLNDLIKMIDSGEISERQAEEIIKADPNWGLDYLLDLMELGKIDKERAERILKKQILN